MHALQDVGVQFELRKEGLAALAHQEHREVVLPFFVRRKEVFENSVEGFLELGVRNGSVTVASEVDSVDLF